LIRRFLQSASIGRPQFAAAALLGVYLLQCLWLARVGTRDIESGNPELGFSQARRVFQGLEQWKGGPIAGTPGSVKYENLPPAQFRGAEQIAQSDDTFDRDRSPLYYLIAAAPLAPWPSLFTEARPFWRWLALAPYLFFGVRMGGSLWYVARRL